MPTKNMSRMWSLLQAHTIAQSGEEREVNHLNEWGGFSKRLNMPVFTGWRDMTTFDKERKTTTALVLDTTWDSAVGVNNQLRWLSDAEQNNDAVAAFFVIHAEDVCAKKRSVKYIDDDRVFVGKIVREGTKVYIVGQPQTL
jgi:hypothetical protein